MKLYAHFGTFKLRKKRGKKRTHRRIWNGKQNENMHNRVARTMPIVFFSLDVYCYCGSQRTLFFSHLENDFFRRFFSNAGPALLLLCTYTHYGILRALFRFVWRLYFSSFDYIHTAVGPTQIDGCAHATDNKRCNFCRIHASRLFSPHYFGFSQRSIFFVLVMNMSTRSKEQYVFPFLYSVDCLSSVSCRGDEIKAKF